MPQSSSCCFLSPILLFGFCIVYHIVCLSEGRLTVFESGFTLDIIVFVFFTYFSSLLGFDKHFNIFMIQYKYFNILFFFYIIYLYGWVLFLIFYLYSKSEEYFKLCLFTFHWERINSWTGFVGIFNVLIYIFLPSFPFFLFLLNYVTCISFLSFLCVFLALALKVICAHILSFSLLAYNLFFILFSIFPDFPLLFYIFNSSF